jgi:hypothetical protein
MFNGAWQMDFFFAHDMFLSHKKYRFCTRHNELFIYVHPTFFRFLRFPNCNFYPSTKKYKIILKKTIMSEMSEMSFSTFFTKTRIKESKIHFLTSLNDNVTLLNKAKTKRRNFSFSTSFLLRQNRRETTTSFLPSSCVAG